MKIETIAIETKVLSKDNIIVVYNLSKKEIKDLEVALNKCLK